MKVVKRPIPSLLIRRMEEQDSRRGHAILNVLHIRSDHPQMSLILFPSSAKCQYNIEKLLIFLSGLSVALLPLEMRKT